MDAAVFSLNRLDADPRMRRTYTNRDRDPRGDWLAVPFHAPNVRPNLTYPIVTPGGRTLLPPPGRCWSTIVVRELARDSAISYDRSADLLYDLAGQLTAHLRSYLPDGEAVRNVVATQAGDLAELIRQQMLNHRDDGKVEYDAMVSGDVHLPRDLSGTSAVGSEVLYFGNTVDDLSRIRLL
jgi:hypothetical protein